MRRRKVLLSAYSCAPGRGSEPGVGWNMARGIAEYHDVWIITRANNKQAIEAALEQQPIKGIRFIYFDLPSWMRATLGSPIYYYLWQVSICSLAKRLHRRNDFDIVHHVTFGRYWSPSWISKLAIPFVWGPVGGGESAPKAFWKDFGAMGIAYEASRELARRAGELDPSVRATAKNAAVALTSTKDTAARLERLGVKNIRHLPGQTGISEDDLASLYSLKFTDTLSAIRFISIGRLLHWKGTHLALRAFARVSIEGAEYWIVGSGPAEQRLKNLARDLGLADKVVFWGEQPREATLDKLNQCHVLVHPSLHDFSPTVCLEAMAASKPVLCLDLGGPAMQITADTGIKVPATSPQQVIQALAEAMQHLAADPCLRNRMGKAGRQRVTHEFSWKNKVAMINAIYQQVLES